MCVTAQHKINIRIFYTHLSIPMTWVMAHQNLEWIFFYAGICFIHSAIFWKTCKCAPVLYSKQCYLLIISFEYNMLIQQKTPSKLRMYLLQVFKIFFLCLYTRPAYIVT